jgi:hypothetical protein
MVWLGLAGLDNIWLGLYTAQVETKKKDDVAQVYPCKECGR